ncbi:hypothetical protein SK3146_04960 [Paenibacillus konkukensis]|uniref:Uncharacterized protein n=1 Tax=Paenibacillus konkukensis TaxID=2020716 RepID=A0ABY4RSW3_9BACL|nr:hypothetical protein [Paenibacillus konkukensis]UQZ85671.1 hypothetical protein SK3146_04960 [Paenibacillus konkukensis]
MPPIKRLVCAALVVSALLLPTSAFASNGYNSSGHNNSYNNKNSNNNSNSKINQSFNDFLSRIFGNKGHNEYHDYWGKEDEFRDWYEKNKDNCPPEESYDIWKKWFCY